MSGDREGEGQQPSMSESSILSAAAASSSAGTTSSAGAPAQNSSGALMANPQASPPRQLVSATSRA
eukprot:scaffold602_cov342-Prasinococcus_capsulatus_cf.AAC.8